MLQFVISLHGDFVSLDLTSDVVFHQSAQLLCFSEYIFITADRNLETIAEAHTSYVEPDLSGSSNIRVSLNRLDLVSL